MKKNRVVQSGCPEFLDEYKVLKPTEKKWRKQMKSPIQGRVFAAALTCAAVSFTSTPLWAEGDPIKIGVLEDQSGDFAAATLAKVHAIGLATKEINDAGGIDGRPIELVVYDTQSDNRRYQEFMRRVLQQDKVDVVFAGFSSASREAYRPIVNQFDGLAFYNNQYEGGVCDANMIVTGAGFSRDVFKLRKGTPCSHPNCC